MKKLFVFVLAAVLLSTGMAFAANDSTVEITGDYRFRYDYLKGDIQDYMQYNPFGATSIGPNMYVFATGIQGHSVKNDDLMTNRFGVNIKANPLEDVSVKARFVMYKSWGHETMGPAQGSYFADRAMGPMDGTVGHVPTDNTMRADYAYATVSNVFGAPAWFSVGRRPSAGGIPGNIRQNQDKLGTAGIPNIMVDYAFDGMTVGYAPDIEMLPGAYAKLCYGKGFDSGYQNTSGATLDDTEFLGLNVVPYDTEKLHVEVQWQKGWNIFSAPPDGMNSLVDTGLMSGGPASGSYLTVNTPVSANMGDMDWLGGVVTSKMGNWNFFVSGAMVNTDPNDNTFSLPMMWVDDGDGVVEAGETSNGGFGLMYDAPAKESRSGTAYYIGARYDMASSGTKIGAEYNHGSKYWIGMVPAGDDMWTSKLGTRGDVYEVYVIQEIMRKANSKNAKAFMKLGYQLYQFEYTGSNSWLGTPKKISDLNTANPAGIQMFAPVKEATDIYATFEVMF